MLLGLLELPPLHRDHLHFHCWGHDLVTGGCDKNVQVCICLKGRLDLLDSTSDIDIGGHFVVWVFWRVVSVGSKLLIPQLSDVHLGSNPVGLAVHDCGHVVLVGGNDLGDGEGGDQRFASTTAPQSRPWSCFACWQ
jgi:hypothetical protein